MKVLYLDESGVPELSSDEEFAIVCGVLIDEDDEKSFQFLIKRIKDKYGLDLKRNIHAVDIFENKNSSAKCYLDRTLRRKKHDLRKLFQEEMWDLIKDYHKGKTIDYYAVTVKKALVRKSLKLDKEDDKGNGWIDSNNFYAKMDRQLPMDIGINAVYSWAIKKTKKAKLKIVFESRSGDHFTVRNHNYITDKGVFKNSRMIAFANNFKNCVVSVGFANKNVQSVGLELADIISYTCNLYFLQIKKKTKNISEELKDSILFKAIHKTLNKDHYAELNQRAVRKYIPGHYSRTRRIANYFASLRVPQSGIPVNKSLSQ